MGLFDRFKFGADKSREPAAVEPATTEPAPAQEAEPRGLFGRLRAGLQKTTRLLNTDIRDLFKSEGRLIDEKFLDEFFQIFVKSDMGVHSAQQLVDRVRTDFRGRVVGIDDVLATVKPQLVSMLEQAGDPPIRQADDGPTVIMVVGVNGSGKTTSIAKLAQLLTRDGKKVVLGAGDTFRAAAVEQLTVWAERIGADIVTGRPGDDPASVAHRAVEHALATGADVCVVDTAGRLQTQQNLMRELTKIHSVIGKKLPGAPHEVLLVLDATTGQNGVSQARHFTDAVQCTGIVLAKMDGSAKGGVVIAIRQSVGLPVRFLGVGERADDLVPFDPSAFVEALFEGLVPTSGAAR